MATRSRRRSARKLVHPPPLARRQPSEQEIRLARILAAGFGLALLLAVSYCSLAPSGPKRDSVEWFVAHPKRALEEAFECSPIQGFTSAHGAMWRERCALANKAVEQLYGPEKRDSVSYFLNNRWTMNDQLTQCYRGRSDPEIAGSHACVNASQANEVLRQYKVSR